MKIDGSGTIAPSRVRPRGRGDQVAGKGGFSDHLAEVARSEVAVGPTAVRSLAPALPFPLGDDQDENKRQAIDHGKALLDRLDEIRHGLLSGTLPRATLRQLVANLAGRPSKATDPGLADLLADIELRARVELAKLDAIR
jgi:Class II flagellar assembly regulator